MEGPKMDPELAAPTLALSRPELAEIRRRYARPEVLVVGPNRGVPIEDGLMERGWQVTTCEGPGKKDCPLLRGRSCDLRTHADVAVVHIDPSKGRSDGGLLGRVRCAAEGSSPALIALDGRLDPGNVEGAAATIGAARSVREIVELVDRLYGPDEDA